MANIKTTPETWEKVKEYYEAGLSLHQIEGRTGVSKSQISKRSTAGNWQKGNEKKQLIEEAVRIREAKGNLSETAVSIHNELVDERTRHIAFFNEAAVKNVKEAMEMECENHFHFKARAEVILKGKETVLGKAPDTAIQINNNTQSPKEIDDEQLIAIALSGSR